MKKKNYHVVLVYLLLSVTYIKAQTISSIAGIGTQGYNGDNKAATIASLNAPAGVISDNAGNIFIADFLNNRIRKIDTNGFITTYAGNGIQGYNGDNIQATTASMYNPEALAIDQAGNLYLADGNNNRIRKISPAGVITTIAGNGTFGYNGDNILATTAQVNYPSDGIVIDASGNIYFSDTYNQRIRKINSAGIITTIAGTGTAGYNGDGIPAVSAQLKKPYGLAIDTAGNLYFADGENHRVRKINKFGVITTVAGTGASGYNGDNITATSAQLNDPIGVAVDIAGNLFIADTYNNRIRKISTGGIITTIAGNGNTTYNGDNIPATLATLNYPNGLGFDPSGSLLIAELGNSRIRKISNVAILPVSLITFTGQLKNNSGVLQWQTSSEFEIDKFIVESGTDGISFSNTGTVKADNSATIHNYSFNDNDLKTDITYYRLKMLDKNGKFSYSNIVTIKKHPLGVIINLFPNPTNDVINLSINSSYPGNFTFQITDIAGKIITQTKRPVLSGMNKLVFDTHKYSSGIYFLSLVDENGKKSNSMFIKN